MTLKAVHPAAWSEHRPGASRPAELGGSMKLLAVVVTATVLGVIIINIINRDDIIRYIKMRQM